LALIQFERLNVRERLQLGETGEWLQPGACAGADDDISPAEPARLSIV
jgi:hypothetical protein